MATALSAVRRLPSRWVDAGIAATLVVVGQVEVWTSAASGRSRPLAALTYGLLCAAVAVRRRWPIGAAVCPFVVAIGFRAAGGGLLVEATAPLLAIALMTFTIGAAVPGRRGTLALASMVALTWLYIVVDGTVAANLLFTVILVALPWSLGRLMAARQRSIAEYRELSERVDAERDERAREAVIDERLRIARELHDVVGHSLSVMVVQSGGARRVIDSDPAHAARMLAAVERIGRETLIELRRLLGVIADSNGSSPSLSPQPGLADVERLVERARAAGLSAELRVEGTPASVGPGLELSAFRIVQEALTNAIKYAAPARASVTIRWTADDLILDVVDDGRAASSESAGSGNGLMGMHERVALFGGNVQAGPRPGHGFAVHAVLPLEPTEVAA